MCICNRQKPATTPARFGATKFGLNALAAATIATLIGTPAQAATTEEKIEILTREVEQLKQERAAGAPAGVTPGYHAGREVEMQYHGATGQTTVGGYGELIYNNLDSGNEINLRRVILFLGHRFNERIRFFSELEVENAKVEGGEEGGEVAMEQAYLDFTLTDKHSAVAGLLLVPVGFLNEVHEPPTFYGVVRNPVETNVIPTTWRELGAGLAGEVAPGWRYDFMVTSGFNIPTRGANAYLVRDGRQEGQQAVANEPAYTARIKWLGLPGVELGAAVQYQPDVTQGAAAESVSAVLASATAAVSRGPFALRALYARWDLDGQEPKSIGRDKQEGWYVEPSFKLTPKLGVFARYNQWNNEAGLSGSEDSKQTNIGVNYWPHPNVVLKADLQNQSGAINDDGFNLGIGYMF